MLKKVIRTLVRISYLLIAAGIFSLLMPRLLTYLFSRQHIYTVDTAPDARVAIVFGAGIRRDGSPTPVLRDRVDTAAKLYFSGKVEKLLMSGDNRFLDYNEPAAMRSYALELGVPDEAIVLDYAGRSTYETCYRARDIFSLREAILITQSFHLPRALYICNLLGVTAQGVSADTGRYRRITTLFWNLRELPATLNALVEVHLTHPLPVLGDPEPIYPLEMQ